jgi:flagellar biosynthesis protein FlhF
MQIHTYRVRSLAEAIRLVRDELGPDAALLHTRQIGSSLSRWLGGRTIEVTAAADANVPSRLPSSSNQIQSAAADDFRAKANAKLKACAAAGIALAESPASSR